MTPTPAAMLDAAETNVIVALAVLTTADRIAELAVLTDAIDNDTSAPSAGSLSVEDMLFVVAGNLHRINKKLRENPSGR
jgi:hypothetical protein